MSLGTAAWLRIPRLGLLAALVAATCCGCGKQDAPISSANSKFEVAEDDAPAPKSGKTSPRSESVVKRDPASATDSGPSAAPPSKPPTLTTDDLQVAHPRDNVPAATPEELWA